MDSFEVVRPEPSAAAADVRTGHSRPVRNHSPLGRLGRAIRMPIKSPCVNRLVLATALICLPAFSVPAGAAQSSIPRGASKDSRLQKQRQAIDACGNVVRRVEETTSEMVQEPLISE